MLVSYILVVGIMVIERVPVSYNLIFMIPLFMALAVVTFGVSTFMLHFGVLSLQ